jgi:hypothetical protein
LLAAPAAWRCSPRSAAPWSDVRRAPPRERLEKPQHIELAYFGLRNDSTGLTDSDYDNSLKQAHVESLMSKTEDAFVRATDELIALYRSVERRTLDLPRLTLLPFLIYLWEFLKFLFFLYVGLFFNHSC